MTKLRASLFIKTYEPPMRALLEATQEALMGSENTDIESYGDILLTKNSMNTVGF